MKYTINITDICILVDVPYFMHPSDSTTEFISPYSPGPQMDLRFEIHPVDTLPEIKDIRYIESRRIYVGEGAKSGTFFRSFVKKPPYACVFRQSFDNGYLICEYLPGNEEYMDYTKNLLTLMDIEATLLGFDALILHASLIRWKGHGIIFSAPSGTGKSTQAELWEQFESADILNGDRAALRQKNGVWTAFGLPYAGTSGIYRNESAPLAAVVALRQAKENRIRHITGAEAFRYLYPETMIHRWDAAFEKHATELLLQIIGNVPVFLLECRPDQGAVSLLRDTLETIIN